MIVKMVEVGGFGCNCYVVGSEKTKDGMIIDPGGDAPAILQTVKSLGLKTKLIVVTHTHPDHIGAVSQVKQATGAPVAMVASDGRGMRGSNFGFPPPTPDMALKGGETLEIGELKFAVLFTPGHHPGEICLYGHGVAFVGDVLFQGSIGRYDFPNADFDALMDSLKTKLMVLPDETIVCPGHGPTTSIGQERKYNPFLTGQAF